MLTWCRNRLGGSQDGFTLIELLVATLASTGLLIALVTLMVTVLQTTSQANARVNATQNTRQALAVIENELHAACVGTGTTQSLSPIQTGAGDSSLSFVSYYGTAINPTPVWHTITYAPPATTSTAGGTLTDYTYKVTGSLGNWTQGASTGSTLLMSNVNTQVTSAGVPIPFFQYFAYQSSPAPDGSYYWTIPDNVDTLPNGTTPQFSPLTTPLSASDADNAVEVLITLSGGASGNTSGSATNSTVDDPETDSISLRLTTPPDEAPSTSASSYGPCQ